MPQNKYSEARQRYVIDQSDEMITKIKSLQRIFYSILLDEYLSNLKTKNGNILPSISNYSLTEKANKRIPVLYADAGGTDFLHGLARIVKKILRLNVDYFSDAVGNRSQIKTLSGPILNKVQRQMGYNYEEKSIVPGGFLSTLIVLESPLAKIKRLAIQSIRSNAQISELLEALRVLVNGETKDQRGIIEKEISDVTQDILPRVDRNISTDFATDLQFSYAIYQGGLIKTSRPFCIARNDKVFHHDEIEKFGTLDDQYGGYSNKPDFDGRTDPYDPFRDLGGHNCRHSLDWISDDLAKQLAEPEPEPEKTNKYGLKQRTIEDFESEIVELKHERGAFYNADGELQAELGDGSANNIRLEPLLDINTEGGVFTHNHPGWRTDPLKQGNSFSIPDIISSINLGFGEVRAVTKGAVYTMQFKSKFTIFNLNFVRGRDNEEYKLDELFAFIKGTAAGVNLDLWDKINSGEIDETQAMFMHWDEVWKRIEKNSTGIKYEKTIKETE